MALDVDHLAREVGPEEAERRERDVGRAEHARSVSSSGKAARRIGVSVRSGLTALTRIPSSAHSSARPWVMFTTAALLAE